jgi:hypothetical protein
MSAALPTILPEAGSSMMSDEALMAKEIERQKRAQAALERMGLAGQMAVKTSKYAPLGTPNISETSVKSDQPVRVPTGDTQQLERVQVSLLGKIWGVLNRVQSTMDKQYELDEEQSLKTREDQLEGKRVESSPIVAAENDNDSKGGMGGMVKMLAMALGPIIAPLAGIAGIAISIKAIADKLNIPIGGPVNGENDPQTGL